MSQVSIIRNAGLTILLLGCLYFPATADVASDQQDILFLNAQIQDCQVRFGRAKKALIDYKVHHPEMASPQDQRRRADLMRDYVIQSEQVKRLTQKRDELVVRVRREQNAQHSPKINP